MQFADTYQHEVMKSRQIRSQRAKFWARITGLVLMLTIGAILRSEPQLRQDLLRVGVDAVLMVSGRDSQPTSLAEIETAQNQASQIRVNRLIPSTGENDSMPRQGARKIPARLLDQ